jgi:hypothetical protein
LPAAFRGAGFARRDVVVLVLRLATPETPFDNVRPGVPSLGMRPDRFQIVAMVSRAASITRRSAWSS